MIPEAVDRALREFEARTRAPAAIQKAARLLDRLVGRGFDSDLVQEVQRLRLPQAVAYAAQYSPFYREMFDRLDVAPSDFRAPEDLRKLPFTSGEEVQDWQQFLCVPREEVAAIYATAGTTGEPKLVPYTLDEMQMLANLSAVAIRVAHEGRLTALIALPMSHGLWMGWATAQRIVERAGGTPLPVGAGDPEETLRWMQRLEPNVLMSSPSYLTVLTRRAQDRGYRPRVDKIVVGGEMLYAAQRARLAEYWDAQVFDSYGATEIGGGQTIVLPECGGAFHLNDLHLVTEIVDPDTGEPAQEGELVFTTLRREAMPLLRYRSGDRARWAECDCWLPAHAIRLQGRVDDMFTAGDMNLYGRVIARSIGKIPGSSGHVELVLEKIDLTDHIIVRVEGDGVEKEEVHQALFEAYPKMRRNIDDGNLVLDIEAGVDLTGQIKAVRITDKRSIRQ